MKRIAWAQRAIDDLLAIPDPAVACAVDAAVQLLAATGKSFASSAMSSDSILTPSLTTSVW